MLALEGLSRHPHLSPSHMPSVTHARVARTHCMYAACIVWALPLRCLCAALMLPVRCMRTACALHARCLCAAMRASLRYHARLFALPCAPLWLPLYPTVGNKHVLEPMPRVLTASVCPAVPPRPRRDAPMVWPWPPHFPSGHAPPLKSILGRVCVCPLSSFTVTVP